MKRRRCPHWLRRRASQPRRNLAWVIAGATLFFIGNGLMYWAEYQLPPSLQQELLALLGMALTLGGGAIALIGYLSLSIFRLIKFLDDD